MHSPVSHSLASSRYKEQKKREQLLHVRVLCMLDEIGPRWHNYLWGSIESLLFPPVRDETHSGRPTGDHDSQLTKVRRVFGTVTVAAAITRGSRRSSPDMTRSSFTGHWRAARRLAYASDFLCSAHLRISRTI